MKGVCVVKDQAKFKVAGAPLAVVAGDPKRNVEVTSRVGGRGSRQGLLGSARLRGTLRKVGGRKLAVTGSWGGVRDRRVPPPKLSVLQAATAPRHSFTLAVGETPCRPGRVDANALVVSKNSPFRNQQVGHVRAPGELENAHWPKAAVDDGASRDKETGVPEAFKEFVASLRRADPLDSDQLVKVGSAVGLVHSWALAAGGAAWKA